VEVELDDDVFTAELEADAHDGSLAERAQQASQRRVPAAPMRLMDRIQINMCVSPG
jgi:hypothetical protein